MKKFLVLTLSLVLVLALAVTANAGIQNTVHDFQSGVAGGQSGFAFSTSARGMCSYCHIPHSSKGDRLWPTTGDTNSLAKTGVVGILCASCHNLTEGNPNNTNSPGSGVNGVQRTQDIYNTALINHVLVDDGIYANNTNQNYFGTVTAQFNQPNVWPYCGTQGTGAGTSTAQNIECSSCHNPHSQAYGQSTVATTTYYAGYGNDYLRASFYNTTAGIAFCEYCHEEKTREGNAGNTIGTGTHPVGTTANAGDAAQADIHIESEERLDLNVAGARIVSSVQYDMGIGTGIGAIDQDVTDNGIGTHLTSYSTGGVTCQTCHKVHGAQKGRMNSWDRGGNTVGSYMSGNAKAYLAASDDGNCNILAIENDANGGTSGYTYPTEGRTTGDYNDLCVDCHETTPSVGANWAASGDSETSTNPDLVSDAHPVNIAPDGRSESGFDLTVQDPNWGATTGWSNARWAGTNLTARSHALDSGNGRWNGTAIPTNTRTEIICLTCHSLHDGEDGTPILRAASTTYCIDCHTASIGGVSHPVGYGSKMNDNPDNAIWPNADTLPLNDYYQGTGGASFKHGDSDTVDMECFTCHAAHDGVDSFMLRVTDDNSRICVGCHTDFRADSHENPANYIAEYEAISTSRYGSHYTGTVSNSNSIIGEVRWTYSGIWTDTTSTRKQTSHWAGGGTGAGSQGTGPGRSALRMQCQSCHTPHDAASGLVEQNGYDGTAEVLDYDNTNDAQQTPTAGGDVNYNGTTTTRMCQTPTTALLLGNNTDSKICATCHWPEGTHVTTIFSVPAKPDPERGSGLMKKYRNYCTRTSAFIITILNGGQETQYNVYDLIAGGEVTDTSFTPDGDTPESPTNFPPLMPGKVPTTSTAKMLCDSCHAPHGAATGAGAFILEAGTGDADGSGTPDITLANQRVAKRNYQDLCWLCHDK